MQACPIKELVETVKQCVAWHKTCTQNLSSGSFWARPYWRLWQKMAAHKIINYTQELHQIYPWRNRGTPEDVYDKIVLAAGDVLYFEGYLSHALRCYDAAVYHLYLREVVVEKNFVYTGGTTPHETSHIDSCKRVMDARSKLRKSIDLFYSNPSATREAREHLERLTKKLNMLSI